MNLNPSENNAFVAVEQLLKLSKVKVTSTTIKNKLLQHPDFPTLISLSDVLTEVNVENMATRINPYQLAEIPLPAIAHLEDGTGYITINKVENNQVEWLHSQLGIRNESISEFSQKWQGITLLAQPNANSGEDNYSKKRKLEIVENFRIPFIIVGLFFIFGYSLWYNLKSLSNIIDGYFYGFILIKIMGVIVSSLLVIYSIDKTNSFLRSVCKINSKTNCNNILNSDAAKIFDWISWSEVGLFYFTGGLMSLLLLSMTQNIESVLCVFKWLNIIALPYTFWSIYYQAFIAKEWCILCLAVQVFLWIEFLILSNIPFAQHTVTLNAFLFTLPSFLLVMVLWTFIKKPLQKAQETDGLYNTLQKMKFDPDYVCSVLSKERMLPPVFEGMEILKIGNPNAKNVITLVLSPLCASCVRTFYNTQKLVRNNSQFRTEIFFATSNDANQIGTQVTLRILSLPPEKMEDAAIKWFDNIGQNFQKWSEEFELINNAEHDYRQLAFHRHWLTLAGIMSAPTIFFNKAELPSFFGVKDIEKLDRINQNVGFANQK